MSYHSIQCEIRISNGEKVRREAWRVWTTGLDGEAWHGGTTGERANPDLDRYADQTAARLALASWLRGMATLIENKPMKTPETGIHDVNTANRA